MSVVSLLITACFLASISYGEECEIPSLPTGYKARIQINSKKGFYENHSHSYEQIVDQANNRSMIHSFREIPLEDGKKHVFEDWFMWNPTMIGVRNFVYVSKDEHGKLSCLANDKADDDLYLFLLGYSETDEAPTVVNSLRFGENHSYVCGEEKILNGVPVKEYKAKLRQDTDPVYEIDIVYYWSDIDKWVGTAGLSQSIPVQATISGKFGRQEENMKEIQLTLMFSSFEVLPIEYNFNFLNPFPAITCDGREGGTGIEHKSPFFSYNFETLTFLQYDGNESVPITVRGKDNYDLDDSLLARELSWVSLSNPAKTNNLYIVKDFDEGLSYETNIDTGKCHIKPIKATDPDAIVSPDGTIVMSHLNQMWDSTVPYSYNGIVKQRGVDVYTFVAKLPHNDSDSKTFAIYFTSAEWGEADTFSFEVNVPMRTETYLTSIYGTGLGIEVIQNIEKFTYNAKDHSFDTSFCLLDTQKRRKMIRFPWKKGMYLDKQQSQISKNIIDAASHCAGIKRRRVQRVEVVHSEDSNLIYVFFDILEIGLITVSQNKEQKSNPPTNTLEMALDNLNECINDSKFVLYVLSQEGVAHTTAEANFFIDVLSADKEAFQNHDYKLYSPGSMAGIAIGMILVGTLLGFASYYGLERFNKVPRIDRIPPFVHFNV